MKVKAVPSGWIRGERSRLDVGPFLYGAVEARERIRRLDAPKEPLKSLTAGPGGGIFNGPQFSRRWVTDPAHGVPFLGSSSMLLADLSHLPLLSRKHADLPKLRHLEVRPGMTLISCSGTIGRMVYARPDMAGMWSSQDIMKVCPDPARIPPGYLYAFLSCRFGLPMVTAGTYGAIIQHIEPEHIANVPVPRLGAELEEEIHDLVELAAARRAEAAKLGGKATRELIASAGLPDIKHPGSVQPFSVTAALSSRIVRRLDAFYHSQFHLDALQPLQSGPATVTVSELAEAIAEPGRYKRVTVTDSSYGLPFFGTSAIQWSDPATDTFLAMAQRGLEDLKVSENTVLVPRSGQLSGIIGLPVLPIGAVMNGAVSEHAIRVGCRADFVAGFLFIFLRSEYGRRQLKARAYGTSIPTLDVAQIGSVIAPKLRDDVVEAIGSQAIRAAQLQTEAIRLEMQARSAVERPISGAA
jgi:type I restriction enzyme, S subunit